jgi:hypothetical protein
MSSRFSRPSPALVLAFVALFTALAGGAYAAKNVAKGSVATKSIQKGAVTSAKVLDDTLTGKDITESSLGEVPLATKATTADSAASADKVGGKTATQLDTRWALINESGMIEQQTGGFSLVNCYQTNANCYLSIGEDARTSGLAANVSVNNSDGSSILSGETGVAACGATTVNCAPPNTEANDVVVVAPRTRNATGDLTGTAPTPGTTPPVPADAARFYVFVTGSKSQ